MSVKMEDFRKQSGNIDWPAYNAAEVAAGETCSQCGHFIFSIFREWTGGPRLCSDCRSLADDAGEVTHDSLLRCPECGRQTEVRDAADSTDYKIYAEGTHSITCHGCEAEFEVETQVSYTFKSPARKKEVTV